jgi:putative membrane protein
MLPNQPLEPQPRERTDWVKTYHQLPSQVITRHPQERKAWFRTLFRIKDSVIPAILPRVIICAVLSVIITYIYANGGQQIAFQINGIIPSIVLGLLLVFRTNTAYDRFWEGRKLWGNINNSIRNLSRTIWISIVEETKEDRDNKIANLYLLIAFAVATKLHLREEINVSELQALMTYNKYEKLTHMNHIPLEIAFLIGDYLQEEFRRNRLNSYQLTYLMNNLDKLVDYLGGCERILKTPMPLAYSIHLKQLLFLYCIALPIEIVDQLIWWTPFFTALISFTVFGIEEIGIEIENPFGKDPNDLPLDLICENMKINLEDLITFAPSVRNWGYEKSFAEEEAESGQPLNFLGEN